MTGTTILDEHYQYRAGELGQVSAYTAMLNADGSVQSSGQYTDVRPKQDIVTAVIA